MNVETIQARERKGSRRKQKGDVKYRDRKKEEKKSCCHLIGELYKNGPEKPSKREGRGLNALVVKKGL